CGSPPQYYTYTTQPAVSATVVNVCAVVPALEKDCCAVVPTMEGCL
ncbi:hypothetical protein A2U01_0091269, partial [Trifolium medium]|nr:hypothetical protein [Trifolium medium]